jgi:type IV pilus assembly protein PilM
VLIPEAAGSGTVAIIDVGANTTTVVISLDGVPQFIRIIPSGGDDLTALLARRLNSSPEQAESIKRTIGMSTASTNPDERKMASIILELASELLNSLRTTLTYFAGSGQAPAIGRVILTGGGVLLPGFGMALSEYTRLPVSLGDPLASLAVPKGAVARATPGPSSAALTVAIGLAMGGAAA